jgi:hypothetical protein
MPRFLDSRDRKLLIGAGFLLLIMLAVAGLLAPSRVTGTVTIPSSYSPAWDGAKGAFLLLRDLGYRVDRWERPAADLPASGDHAVLILADPMEPPTADDRTAIRTFLATGGRVLATGTQAAPFLPGAVAFSESVPWTPRRDFPALLPSPLARGVHRINLLPPTKWKPHSPSHLAVFGDDKTAAVVTWPFGKGQIIWWASPVPLTNGGIRESDNLALLLNSLGAPGQTRVFWDEYYHGVRASLWSFFQRTPVPWILAQFGLVFLALLFTFSRRHGPARMPAAVSRLSPLEFVETLGDLYHTARAGPAAVSIAYDRLHFLLIRRLALPANASLPEVSRGAAERFGWDEAPLFDTLSRSERARRSLSLDDAAALQLVREIHHYIARLRSGSAGGRKGNPS